MDWQDNRCDCGQDAGAHRLYVVRDKEFRQTEETATMLKCRVCGTLFPERFPTKETIGEAYGAYYTDVSYDNPVHEGAHRELAKSGKLRRLINGWRETYALRGTSAETKRLLDYGCGSGAFLNLAKAQERFGADIAPVKGEFTWIALDELATGGRNFDWVTLGHVIEHVMDADAALSDIQANLAPGGGIWIATPNADGFLIRAFGPMARDADFPRHRQIYSEKGLIGLLERNGLSVQFLRPPRINALFNFLSCLRLTRAEPGLSAARKLWMVGYGGFLLALHLIMPLRRNDPEFVVVARAEKTPS